MNNDCSVDNVESIGQYSRMIADSMGDSERAQLKRMMYERLQTMMQVSMQEAERCGSDSVSAEHVHRALQSMGTTTRTFV